MQPPRNPVWTNQRPDHPESETVLAYRELAQHEWGRVILDDMAKQANNTAIDSDHLDPLKLAWKDGRQNLVQYVFNRAYSTQKPKPNPPRGNR